MQAGNVSFDSNPQGSTVCMDRQPISDPIGRTVRTPVIVTNIHTGIHRFVFHIPGYHREDVIANIIERQTIDIFATLTPRW